MSVAGVEDLDTSMGTEWVADNAVQSNAAAHERMAEKIDMTVSGSKPFGGNRLVELTGLDFYPRQLIGTTPNGVMFAALMVRAYGEYPCRFFCEYRVELEVAS